jgi:SAM-dependent methyltransferase
MTVPATRSVLEPSGRSSAEELNDRVRAYWNDQIHDLAVARSPVGSREFFRELDAYRFGKLQYLPTLVDFAGYRDREVLEVGCGAGIDLLRFARGGARVTGVDLAETAVELAKQAFAHESLAADLRVVDATRLPFEDHSFDLVYGHGVLQYAADPEGIVAEMKRVLRPGGQAIVMVYNRRSWLAWMSAVLRTPLEHTGAPVFRMYTAAELESLLAPLGSCRIVPERFPARTVLQRGWKAALYNGVLIPLFELIPRRWIRPFGWHLMAFCGAEVVRQTNGMEVG